MANDYDKIFRENIEELILPLVEKLMNLKTERMEEIPDDLQWTIERKPDFLKKILHKDRSKDYVLHIEFQSSEASDMVYRMHEYYAMLLRQYELDVYQYVVYLGLGKSRMLTAIEKRNLTFSYDLINLQDFDYKLFMESNKPEEVVLAILADFGSTTPKQVITELLMQLKSMKMETLKLQKYVVQLEVLSNLRNLQQEIINQIQKIMAIKYDIKKDIRYQQGLEQGLERGLEQGLEQGLEKGLEKGLELGEQKGEENAKIKGIRKSIKKGKLTIAEIADVFDVSIEYVEAIKKEME